MHINDDNGGIWQVHERLPLSRLEIPLLKLDGFVKSPSAALRFILRHCGVLLCTPHSSRFARLASEAFYCAVYFDDFAISYQRRHPGQRRGPEVLVSPGFRLSPE